MIYYTTRTLNRKVDLAVEMDAAMPVASDVRPLPGARKVSGGRLAAVMGALMLSLLLEALDQTVVGTALPRIVGTLHGFSRYTWAVTAYLLASTTMLPVAGKLSDQFGRKTFLLTGIVIFLIGSALGAAAATIDQLIVFRALQGLGAGVGISLVFTAVADLFPPQERARWQGVLGSVYGLSSVAGPTLGGWLTDHGPLVGQVVTEATRWRWVFLVNLPLGILAVVTLIVYLPAGVSVRSSRHTGWAAVRRIDGLGAILSVAASTCLLIGLTEAGETGTGNAGSIAVTLTAGIVLLAAFVVVERHAVEPILPFHLFRNRIFAADSVLTMFLYMTLFGTAFFVPLFLQGVAGLSPTEAGIIMTPFSLSIVAGNILAGASIARLVRYRTVTIAGTLIMTAGVALLARMTARIHPVTVAVIVAVAGLGMGVLFTATGVAVQNSLPPTHLGVGLGIVRYLGGIGGTLGVTIVGAVVNYSIAADLPRRFPATTRGYLPPHLIAEIHNPQALLTPSLRATVLRAAVRHDLPRIPASQARAAVAAMEAHRLVNHIFAALRLSLAVAIRHGLEAALFFSVAAIAAGLVLRDPER